jgi:hypothetical protein
MTTGRINQITHLEGTRHSPGGGRRGPQPPEGQKFVKRKGRTERPAGAGTPAYRGDATDHPIAPTEPLSAGPHAGTPAGPPSRAGAGCGIRPSGGGSGPRGQRRRTADPTGRLPPGILVSGVASGHPSTDSSGAGGQVAPGLRAPQRRPTFDSARPRRPRAAGITGAPPGGDAPNAHTRRAAAGEGPADAERSCSRRSPPVLVPGPRRHNTPEPGRRSVLQGRCRGERGLSPLHILSDPTWEAGRGAIVHARENCCQGHGLLWGWSVHGSFSHTKWATFLRRPDPFVRTW